MKDQRNPYVIVIPVYEEVDLLDVAAPHEMFGWLRERLAKSEDDPREVELWTVGRTTDLVTTRDGFSFQPHKCFDDIDRVDLLWTPGGGLPGLKKVMSDETMLAFLRRAASTAEWITCVCEGALLQASAGLLDGYQATTHWAFKKCLERDFPKVTVVAGNPRFVVDRDRVTGGGISSGLDESLKLIELVAGPELAIEIQRTTQYYPQPPVCGAIPTIEGCPLDKVK